MYSDGAANLGRQWHGGLVDADRQDRAIPGERTWPDGKRMLVAEQVVPAPLGHAPAAGSGARQHDVDGAVVQRIAPASAARPGVIGGKDAADEGDDGQAMTAV